MKLSLGPVRVGVSAASVASVAFAMAFGMASVTGCAGSAPGAASPSAAAAASGAVGTTSLTSAALTPSSLAPAAWDGDDQAPSSPLALPTWGTAVATGSASTPSPSN